MDQDEEKYERYRRLAIQHISINKNAFTHFLTNFGGSVDRYLQKMAQNGTWGGHMELQALSKVLNKCFCIYNDNFETIWIGRGGIGQIQIYLAYDRKRFHYSSLTRIPEKKENITQNKNAKSQKSIKIGKRELKDLEKKSLTTNDCQYKIQSDNNNDNYEKALTNTKGLIRK